MVIMSEKLLIISSIALSVMETIAFVYTTCFICSWQQLVVPHSANADGFVLCICQVSNVSRLFPRTENTTRLLTYQYTIMAAPELSILDTGVSRTFNYVIMSV